MGLTIPMIDPIAILVEGGCYLAPIDRSFNGIGVQLPWSADECFYVLRDTASDNNL